MISVVSYCFKTCSTLNIISKYKSYMFTDISMPPTDISAWLKDFMHSVHDLNAVKSIQESSYFSPKQIYSVNTQQFYIYVQPVIITLIIIWLILSLKLLWIKDFTKKYGLMTAYTCLDILAFIMQDIFLIIFLSSADNYVQYEWCYVFEAFTQYVPGCLHMVATWLKLGQSIRMFLIFYKPLHVKIILSNFKIMLYIFVSVVISCSISVGSFTTTVTFGKAILMDRSTGNIKEVCRDDNFFKIKSENSSRSKQAIAVQILIEVYKGFLPSLCMILLTGGILFLLKRQERMRTDINRQQTNREEADERLAQVTILATVIYTIVALPSLLVYILLQLKSESQIMHSHSIYEVLSVLHSTFVICNVPITFIIYSWLSKDVRNNFYNLKKRICRYL